MPVIAVINRKGGSGKSTLATHLAAWMARQGATVMLGDVDRQQSTRAWLKRREPPLPSIVPWTRDRKHVFNRHQEGLICFPNRRRNEGVAGLQKLQNCTVSEVAVLGWHLDGQVTLRHLQFQVELLFATDDARLHLFDQRSPVVGVHDRFANLEHHMLLAPFAAFEFSR